MTKTTRTMTADRKALVTEVISVAREMLIGRLGRTASNEEIVRFVPVAYAKDAAVLLG